MLASGQPPCCAAQSECTFASVSLGRSLAGNRPSSASLVDATEGHTLIDGAVTRELPAFTQDEVYRALTRLVTDSQSRTFGCVRERQRTMPGIVVASANGNVGIGAAIEVLRAGGTAVDAVVAGIELVEANPLDHSVGYSGLPNLLGEVELDASIMDGAGLRAGSVGALHGYQDAVALARIVMDTMPHVLIVGAGADRLASETGLDRVDLLTDEATSIWKQRFAEMGSSAPGTQDAYYSRIHEIVGQAASDPQKVGLDLEDVHGTVNFIAMDESGSIACGVSTSGWAWKYPGRLGDSPIIGAGNYADNRWGAAACTGRGEMAQRC